MNNNFKKNLFISQKKELLEEALNKYPWFNVCPIDKMIGMAKTKDYSLCISENDENLSDLKAAHCVKFSGMNDDLKDDLSRKCELVAMKVQESFEDRTKIIANDTNSGNSFNYTPYIALSFSVAVNVLLLLS